MLGERAVNASRETKKSCDATNNPFEVGTASYIKVHMANQTNVDAYIGSGEASLAEVNLVNETQLYAEDEDKSILDAESAEGATAVQQTSQQRQAARAATNGRQQLLEAPRHVYGSAPVAKVIMLPQDLQDDVTRKVAHMFGVQSGAECNTEGDVAYFGCAAGCKCGLGRTCYKRYMYVDENIISASLHKATGNSSDEKTKDFWGVARINMGTCELATPVLVAISLLGFSTTLLCVIGWRMWLQAQSLYMTDVHYATDPGGIKVMWPNMHPSTDPRGPEDTQATKYPEMDDDDLNMMLPAPTDRRGTILNRPA